MPRLLVLLFLLVMLVPQSLAARFYQVENLDIEGNKRVEEGYIKSLLSVKPGGAVSTEEIDQDIRTLFATGRFEDVAAEIVERNGQNILVYRVEERPLLREVVFSGNSEIKTDKLGELINAKGVNFFRPQLLDVWINTIKRAYVEEGYYATQVEPQVDVNQRNEATVTLAIDEGEQVFVEEIRFEGNTVFSDKEIKKALLTKEKWFLSFITGRGAYKEDMLAVDQDIIADLYYNQGYIQVKVKKPLVTLQDDQESMDILFEIEEGRQFRIGDVGIQGDLLLPREELMTRLTLQPGEVFSRKELRENIAKLTDLYADEGYAFVNVTPQTEVQEEAQRIDVTFEVEQGLRVIIGNISISGNTRTRDKVLRREMLLAEGDFYSAGKMKSSRRRINNLGFFEEVNLTTSRGANERFMDIEIDVKEKPTGSFSVGAGFSSVDGLMMQGSLSQDNFLGRALRFDLAASLGGRSTTYRLGLLDPYFLDKNLGLGGDIYKTEREWTDFERKATGGDIKLQIPLTENLKSFFVYRYEDKEIKDVDEDASELIKSEEGKSSLSSISASLTRNTTDYRPDPTTGNITELSIEFAGLGGSERFVKYIADHRYFYPLPFWSLVFSARGQIGYIQEMGGRDIPLDERFFLGGLSSLRGFESREVGPRDDETGDFYGGNKEAFLNLELIFPLVKEMNMKGVVFFDAGNAWGTEEDFFDELRYSVGAGVRWNSPMGPLRFEWGYNLDPKDYEESSVFDFSVGRMF
ncbi:MAG: outer membrane protein assembly factor BamA [Syntrophotaleaceae bacterium]